MLPLRYMELYRLFFLIYDGSFSRNSCDAGPLILTQKKKNILIFMPSSVIHLAKCITLSTSYLWCISNVL